MHNLGWKTSQIRAASEIKTQMEILKWNKCSTSNLVSLF
jgi:hypothetical protein